MAQKKTLQVIIIPKHFTFTHFSAFLCSRFGWFVKPRNLNINYFQKQFRFHGLDRKSPNNQFFTNISQQCQVDVIVIVKLRQFSFFSTGFLPKLNNPVSCRFITINWTIGYIGNNPWGSVTLNNTSLLCLWQKIGKV